MTVFYFLDFSSIVLGHLRMKTHSLQVVGNNDDKDDCHFAQRSEQPHSGSCAIDKVSSTLLTALCSSKIAQLVFSGSKFGFSG